MSLRARLLPAVAALAALALVAAGCGGSSDTEAAGGGTTIVVGSFGFEESETLAHIYGGALRNAGAEVRYAAFARDAVAPALDRGEVDLLPVYAGPYLTYLDRSFQGGLPLEETVAKARDLAKARGLTLPEASGATDGDVLAITKDLSNKRGVLRISDLKKLDAVRLAGPPVCETQQSCLLGLRTVYGISSVAFASTEQPKRALLDGTADVARVSSSDPDLEKSGKFLVLEDDLSYQPPGNILPVIRTAKASEAIVKVLDRVSKLLTEETLLELNKRTYVERDDPAKVAAEFLAANTL